jgi:hypothetical protein
MRIRAASIRRLQDQRENRLGRLSVEGVADDAQATLRADGRLRRFRT